MIESMPLFFYNRYVQYSTKSKEYISEFRTSMERSTAERARINAEFQNRYRYNDLTRIQEKIFQVLRIKRQLESIRFENFNIIRNIATQQNFRITQFNRDFRQSEALLISLNSLVSVLKREGSVLEFCKSGINVALNTVETVEKDMIQLGHNEQDLNSKIELLRLEYGSRIGLRAKLSIPFIWRKDEKLQIIEKMITEHKIIRKQLKSYLSLLKTLRPLLVFFRDSVNALEQLLTEQLMLTEKLRSELLSSLGSKDYTSMDITKNDAYNQISILHKKEMDIVNVFRKKIWKNKIAILGEESKKIVKRNKKLLAGQTVLFSPWVTPVSLSALAFGPVVATGVLAGCQFIKYGPTIAAIVIERKYAYTLISKYALV